MDESEVESLKAARELAWRYFALHANQRLDVLKSYLTLMTITFAGFGLAFQIKSYVLGIALGLFATLLAGLFYLLDLRTRILIKACEKYLKSDESRLSQEIGDTRIRLFEASDRWADYSRRLGLRITYGRVLDLFFALNGILALVVVILFGIALS